MNLPASELLPPVKQPIIVGSGARSTISSSSNSSRTRTWEAGHSPPSRGASKRFALSERSFLPPIYSPSRSNATGGTTTSLLEIGSGKAVGNGTVKPVGSPVVVFLSATQGEFHYVCPSTHMKVNPLPFQQRTGNTFLIVCG